MSTKDIINEAISFGFKPVLLYTNLEQGLGKSSLEKDWITKYSNISKEDLLKLTKHRNSDNVGVLCGIHSNIIIIDVDIQDNGVENWSNILEQNNINDLEDFETPIVRTGSNGLHYYFKYPNNIELKSKLEKGIDILSTGKCAVYPGSLYPGCVPLENENKKHKCGSKSLNDCIFRGNEYSWIKSPVDVEIKDIPKWLLPLISKKSNKKHINNENNIIENFDNTNDQDRLKKCLEILKFRAEDYPTWRDTVWCIKGMGFSKDVAIYFSKFSEKYDDNPEELNNIWDQFDSRVNWNWGCIRNWMKECLTDDEYDKFCSIYFKNVEEEYRLFESDYGLAQIFSEIYKEKLIIIDENGEGYLFNETEKIYVNYGTTYLSHLISKALCPIVDKYIQIYTKLEDDITKAKLREIRSVKKYILSTKGCKQIYQKVICNLLDTKFYNNLDNNDTFLPIKNGKIINIKTCEVRDRTNKDYFTFECPVEYTINNENRQKVLSYIKSICNGDENYVKFLLKFFGYCFTREISDRSLYILYGDGCNGKSSLLKIIEIILGKLTTACSCDVLIKNDRKGGATPELIPLITARIAILNETKEGDSLNSERIKKLTGDDLITARALFKNEITFRPKCKLLLITNKKPIFDANDRAMTDRIKLLPFLARFEKCKENDELVNDMQTKYLDDFFSLIIEAGREWWKDKNLSLPEIASNETKNYFCQNDTISMFIKDKCIEGKDYREQPQILFEAYSYYCQENEVKKESKQKFGEIISKRYGEKVYLTIDKKRLWFYKGIKLL